jgi:hypothetical protein
MMENECKMKCHGMTLAYHGECRDHKSKDSKDYGKYDKG